MTAATREVWRALLLPVLVFGAVCAVLLTVLLGERIEGGDLAVRLAITLGLAFAAALLAAHKLQQRARRQLVDPLTEVVRKSSKMLDHFDPALEASDAERELPELASRLRQITDHAAERVERLEGEREHLLTVLGSMSEGVMVTDSNGRTVLVNSRWRQLFEVTGEVTGRTALELTRQTELDRMIAETLASGEGQQIELEITRVRRRTVILDSSPLTNGAGLVVLARDLTPFLRLGEIRRDFVANVSHELKTPLSAIRGFAETLFDGAIDDPRAANRFTERILRQCKRLEALLSDLLTLSRLEHPAASRGWGEVDLGAVVDEAIELTSEGAVERGIELEREVAPVREIRGDAEALVRMCINLLENAIKYNRANGRVGVLLTEQRGTLVLEVTDTGIGIPPDSLDRLFERFYRVDKGRSRAEGGTGLGLAIVKHAAQLHGGSVEVESELGRGSTFRVRLPSSA